jgi:hypothetical protein
MIVLDEQLLGRGIELEISRWYRGKVLFITDLRPGTVIKDDAIPKILRQFNQPTFITINVKDFWRTIPIDNKFSVICFPLPDSRAMELAPRLRVILQLPEFSSKGQRMGKVVRVGMNQVSYYTCNDSSIKNLVW